MGRSLRFFSQRKNPINIYGCWVLMFRTKSFAENRRNYLYSKHNSREFVLLQGAISNVPGKRKTESKKSIFLSVLGKCEYEMCLVSTWKADTVYLRYRSGL